jgi:hypothetical protein
MEKKVFVYMIYIIREHKFHDTGARVCINWTFKLNFNFTQRTKYIFGTIR